jgi:hypothetical protein
MNFKYIPIKVLNSFLGYQQIHELQNFELSLSKLEEKYSSGEKLVFNGKMFSFAEIEAFLKTIQGEEQVVFIQWIEVNRNLLETISSNLILKNDFLVENYKEHFLFPKFKKFISSFLYPNIIQDFENKKENEILLISSYISILDNENSFILQDKFVKKFKVDWSEIQEEIKKISQEKELIKCVGNYFSDQKIEILNCFTKEFYHAKIELIEQGIELFKHSATTNRIAFWLINQLKKMSLNAEHEQKIKDIYLSIKNGENTYFKRVLVVSTSINFKKISVFFLGIAALFLLVFFFFEKNKFVVEDEIKSTFSHFSKEERIHMDSIIKSIKKKEVQDDEEFDAGKSYLHLSQVNIEIENREEFKNLKVEKFIQNELKLKELIVQDKVDSCQKIKEKSLNSIKLYDYKSLKKNIGNKKMFFKNESSYQILILNFENSIQGKVYFHILNPKDELEFLCQTQSEFIFLPGNNFGKVILNQQENENLSNLYHFCFTDENYDAQLLISYKLKNASQDVIKVLFNETKNKEFYILDLYEALEK